MLLPVLSLVSQLLAVAPEAPVDYLKDVKPVLAEKCFACHGALQQKADLRLDSARGMLEGGNKGAVVVPGNSADSLLLKHVLGRDGARRMPPPSDGEPLSAEQVAKLRTWIDQGAKAPPGEKPEADPREHWAFRAPKRGALPAEAPNLVDAFLDAERTKRGLKAQPPVEKKLLLRRIYLDLIGLPPTLEEQDAFLKDMAPDAYEKVVDRLLRSPQHGERWGRHWMDIWRYSDWWGLGQEVRNSQKHIWHWRDWIIESLNKDVGYDQMVREMLAADELYPNDLQRLRASGFLARHYFKFNRTTWLDDTVEHTAKAFMGLTLNCAKCHDHKYDPFAQADFYQLRAFFEPYQVRTEQIPGEADVVKNGIPRAYDCNLDAPTYLFVRGDDRQPLKEKPIAPGLPKLLTWAALDIEPIKLPVEAHTPGLRPFVLENNLAKARRQLDQANKVLAKAREVAPPTDKSKAALRAAEAAALVPTALVETVKARAAADRAKAEASPQAAGLATDAARKEQQLAVLQAEEAVFRAEADLAGLDAGKKAEVEKKLAAARTTLEQARKAAAKPGSDYTPLRGAVKTPESNLETGPSLTKPFPTTSTGRRSALARWLTDGRNPLTARVAVNHIWARHFGTPLVATVFDFGRKGAAPTHPELLDTLAVEFMDKGWSMKHLHRLIVTSQAYRLSSSALAADPKTVEADPENRYYWRRHALRMEAQVVRDSLLHLAGQLELTLGGPSVPIQQEMSPRRSLYFVHSNNDNQKFLSQFDDAGVRECYRRSESIVPQQALTLANSKLALTAAAKITERLERKYATATDEIFVQAAFELLLGCDPTPEESAECLTALAEWRKLAGNRADARTRSRAHLVHALINHNDFVTIR